MKIKKGVDYDLNGITLESKNWKEHLVDTNNCFAKYTYFAKPLSVEKGILTDKEYKLLVDLYSLFVSSFKKGSWEKILEKSISAIQNEITFLVSQFGISAEDFLKKINISTSILSEIFKNRLKKAETAFQKKYSNVEEDRKKQLEKFNKKKNQLIKLGKQQEADLLVFKHEGFKSLVDFLEEEIFSEYTHKIKTELALKVLIFLSDEQTLSLTLFKKINGILKNTELKIVLNEKQTWEEIRNILVFEMLKGLRPYREKLLSWYGHTSKVLSYMDRIARNVCLTNNQKIANNSYEMFGLVTESDASSDDSKGDDIAEFSNTYIEESSKIVENLKKDSFMVFNSWNYLLKSVLKTSTILQGDFIHKLHSFTIETEKKDINLVLNKTWFYFFDKITKSHNIYGKIINSYFDLVFLLHYTKGYNEKEIMSFLFASSTIKFAVRSFDWDNCWEVFFYEIKNSDIKSVIWVEEHFNSFKRRIAQLINLLCNSHKISNEKAMIRAIGEIFKVIYATEKIFILGIYDKLFNDHNIAYFNKIIKLHLKQQQKKYLGMVDLVENSHKHIKFLTNMNTSQKKNYENIKFLCKELYPNWHTYILDEKSNLTEREKALRTRIRKFFPKIKVKDETKRNFSSTIIEQCQKFIDVENQKQFLLHKKEILDEFNRFGNLIEMLVNENSCFELEEELQKKERLIAQYKEKLDTLQQIGTRPYEVTKKEMEWIQKNEIFSQVIPEDENFLPTSQFYWKIQYILS